MHGQDQLSLEKQIIDLSTAINIPSVVPFNLIVSANMYLYSHFNQCQTTLYSEIAKFLLSCLLFI